MGKKNSSELVVATNCSECDGQESTLINYQLNDILSRM